MKAKLNRETVIQSVAYHADNSLGLCPVLESDRDVEAWLELILRECSLGDDAQVIITVNSDEVIVDGDKEVMEAVRYLIL